MYLFVQGDFQLQLPGAHEEVLADDGAGLAALARRRELDFADPHGHTAPRNGSKDLVLLDADFRCLQLSPISRKSTKLHKVKKRSKLNISS